MYICHIFPEEEVLPLYVLQTAGETLTWLYDPEHLIISAVELAEGICHQHGFKEDNNY